jgi:uncharacterized protein involved in outer membrane biogenesis
MKKALKIVGILFALFMVLIVGAVIVLRLMYPPEKIKALVIPHIEKALGRDVAVDKAGVSIIPLGVSIDGLRISNTKREGFSKEPFVKVGHFGAQISLGSIFRRAPEITNIVISKPEIRVEVDQKGSFNFDDLALLAKDSVKKEEPVAKSGGLPQLPVPITLKKFTIENGVIIYDDQKAGNQIVIGAVNDEVGFSIDKELKDIKTSGALRLTDVSVRTKEIKKPLSKLSITLSHDIAANLVEGTVNIKEVRLSLQKIFLTLKGTMKNAMTPAPEFDLTVASDPIAVSDVLREIPAELFPDIVKLTASGTAELGLTVKGALAQGKPLPVQGKLLLKGITIRDSDLPQAINDLNADIAFTDHSLAVNEMRMKLGTNPIDLKATVTNFAKPLVDASLKADIKLAEIKEVVKLPQGSSLDGEIAADIKAHGEADPADPTKLDLKGIVELKNVKMLWLPLLKPAVFDGKVTLTSKAVGQNIAVTIGQSSLTMNATVSNYLSMALPDKTKKLPRTSVEFKMASPMLDLDEIIMPPPKKEEIPAEKSAGGPLLAPLPGVDMKGLVTARKIVYKGIPMDNMTAKIAIVNDIADVDFSTGFAGGSIGEVLHANLADVNNVTFTNNLSIKSVEINDLMTHFGSFIKPVTPLNRAFAKINSSLFGRVNLQSSMSGNGGTTDGIMKSLAGNATVQMSNGKVQDAPFQLAAKNAFTSFLKTDKIGNFDAINFRDLGAAIHLVNSRAVFDNIKLLSDETEWNARGSVGFDALMDMAVSTKLSKAISEKIVALENTIKSSGASAAKGLANQYLKGTNLGGVADKLTNELGNVSLIPRDNQGRIPLEFKLGGPVSKPAVTGLAFGQGSAAPSATQPGSQQQPAVKQQAQQVVAEKKQEVQQKVEEKKQEVKQEVKKQGEEIKKNAVNKLKGLFNK